MLFDDIFAQAVITERRHQIDRLLADPDPDRPVRPARTGRLRRAWPGLVLAWRPAGA